MVVKMINNIKELRTQLKLTQEDLAKMCGVSRQTINAIENDKYDPSLQLAFDLAKVLKSTIDDLFIYESSLKE